MPKPIIHNLDEKQNPPEMIILGGIEMDISFIPCGVAIPLTQAYEVWRDHFNKNSKDIAKNNDLAQENTILLAKTVAVFTKFMDDKIDEYWLLKNLTPEKVGFIFRKIMNAISGNVENKDNSPESTKSEPVNENKKKEVFDGNVQ